MNRIGPHPGASGRHAVGALATAVAVAAIATACGSSTAAPTSTAADGVAPASAASTAGAQSGAPTSTASVSAATTTQRASGLDACVVNQWTSTSIRIGTATGEAGARLSIGADGSATVDFGPASPITATVNGRAISQQPSGVATLHFATVSGGKARVDDQDFSGITYTQTSNGASVPGGRDPKEMVSENITYTCSASTLALTDSLKGSVYTFSR